MKKLILMIIMIVLFSAISYGSEHESFLKIDSDNFNYLEVDRRIEEIEYILDNSQERRNIIDRYNFNNTVDRDVFLYKLLSVSGYNVYIEDALKDSLGLNLIDNEIYDSLCLSDTISSEMYKKIMARYLYFDLKNREKNIIYYMVEKGYLDSSQVLLEGGSIVSDISPEGYFKSDFYYMRLPSKDILKSFYLGLSKENLLMDRSSYLFVPHVNQEKFYDMDFIVMDRISGDYTNLTDKMDIDFDSEDYRYYPSKRRFWISKKEGEHSSFYMKVSYRDEVIKVEFKREVDSFIMMEHDQEELEVLSYYIIRSSYGDMVYSEDILTDSKKYKKSYIGIRYRDDLNPSLPLFFNKPGTSNYNYGLESADTKYNNKVFVYDKDLKPYRGYLLIDIKDRSGRKYVSRMKIKPDGLVNIIFYDNRFNRIMNLYVEDENGKRVSDIYSVNSKSNDNLTINIK